MSWTGARYGDGAGGSTQATVAATLGCYKSDFLQFVMRADPSNSGIIYYGGSTVATDGVGAWGYLQVGESLTIGPGEWSASLSNVYLIGSDGNQKAYLTLITRRPEE